MTDPPAPAHDSGTPDPGSAAASAESRTGRGGTQVQEPTRTERTIARRTSEARATVPDIELRAEADMSAFVTLRAAGGGPSLDAFLARACALALRHTPRANAAYRDGRYELYSRVNVGVAVDTPEGYVAVTLFDADRKPASELGSELERLGARARSGEITPPESSGATFTVTNLGRYGVADVTAVINPPQAAALAAGAVRAAPIVRDGAVVPGHAMSVTLACDHRILFGEPAARFLVRIRELLEAPEAL
jgi:pyruvate dehydrogenase E2 component (dihydrolipoamide acetyltransferase)